MLSDTEKIVAILTQNYADRYKRLGWLLVGLQTTAKTNIKIRSIILYINVVIAISTFKHLPLSCIPTLYHFSHREVVILCTGTFLLYTHIYIYAYIYIHGVRETQYNAKSIALVRGMH